MSVQARKIKMTLNFREDKPTVYKLTQVNIPAVTYEQLVNEVAMSQGINTGQTRAVVDALVNRLVHYMEIGHLVKLGSFGSFKPDFRSKTSKRIDGANQDTIVRKIVRFFPGKQFKNMLDDMSIVSASELLDDEE